MSDLFPQVIYGLEVGETHTALLPYVPRMVADWASDFPTDQWLGVDATMVFADLSGFTAMSERLSRLGRMGAEEVTDAIGTCFAELLAVAYAAGGGLLKFGGDALLLAFTGAAHVERGVASAAAMRERLRTAGRIKTSAGLVTLRMSVGVHTGRFDCFLVGSPTRELLVTGIEASTVVAMEHDASAGQIVISPAIAAALEPRCVGQPLGPGFLLKRSPHLGPHASVARADVRAADLRGFVPEAVSAHVLAGGGEPEHRSVTVGFVHFDGLDERCARDGPAATARALHDLVSIVEAACGAHDVAVLATDVDSDGGKFLLAAGAPTERGHNEARMLAVARRIVEADPEIPVRVGVHRGPVFAGDVGPPYRRTYTVMGDTVNLAARLMAAAPPGAVYASGPVVDRAPAFAIQPLPPMQVKGKRAPVHAFAVGPAGTTARREQAGGDERLALPFVGREHEMQQLLDLTEEAISGRGVSAYLVGPSGIGKTRLVAEMVQHAPGLRLVRVGCEAYEAATPHAALRRLLRAVLDLAPDCPPTDFYNAVTDAVALHAPDLGPWLPLLAEIVGVEVKPTRETEGLAPQFRAARTVAAFAQLIVAQCREATLLLVEDDEWMDDASRDGIDVLAAHVANAPVFLLRASLHRPDSGPVIELAPLPRADVQHALLRATEGRPLRPHELEALTDRADGNPLFLTELWRVAGDASEGLPDSVEALVTAEIDRLPFAQRQVLSFAAVLGRGFDRATLAALAHEDMPIDDDLWLALGEYLELDGTQLARFRHGLIRDAAYAKLSYRRRRELHLRAALTIESAHPDDRDQQGELLSLHFYEAQAFREAWDYARSAGDRARERYANVEAAVLLERALAAARRLGDVAAPELAAVREALGEVRDRNGEYEAARLNFRTARRLVAGNPTREAELFLKEAWIPERIGRFADAVRLIRRGWRLVDAQPGVAAARARAQLAVFYAALRQAQGKHREAIEWGERAITDAIESGDRASEAYALYVLDWAVIEMGALDRAVNLARARTLYEELGDLSGQGLVLNLRGAVAYWNGRWDEAVELYEAALDAYTRAGSAVDAARSAANIAEVRFDQGRIDEAEHVLADAQRVAQAAEYRYEVAWNTSLLARVEARRGAHDAAAEMFAAARAEFANTGLHGEVVRVDAWHAESLLLAGQAAAALALADDVLARQDDDETPAETPLLQRVRAEALAQLGDIAAARAAVDASLVAAQARDADYELALTYDAIVRVEAMALDEQARTNARAERDARFESMGITPAVRRD